jgi:hypothetical protein
MEIGLLSDNALRVKGKKSVLLVDVSDTTKIEANAYLFLTQSILTAKANSEGLLIGGPGDYEVSGTKISVTKSGEELVYVLTIDGMKIFFSSTSAFLKMKDKVEEQDMVILYCNESIDQAAVTNAQPSVVVCYGEKGLEVSKNLGKGLNKQEDAATPDAEIKPVDKFTIATEKLPAEMQIVLLG